MKVSIIKLKLTLMLSSSDGSTPNLLNILPYECVGHHVERQTLTNVERRGVV